MFHQQLLQPLEAQRQVECAIRSAASALSLQTELVRQTVKSKYLTLTPWPLSKPWSHFIKQSQFGQLVAPKLTKWMPIVEDFKLRKHIFHIQTNCGSNIVERPN